MTKFKYIVICLQGWTVSNDSKVRGVTTTAEQQHGESVFSHLLEVKLTLELDNLQHNSGRPMNIYYEYFIKDCIVIYIDVIYY